MRSRSLAMSVVGVLLSLGGASCATVPFFQFPAPTCVTPCGAKFYGPGAPDCEEAALAEARVLKTHLRFGLHCGLMKGLTINTLETDGFQDPWNRYGGKPIGGLTYCWASYVVIGNASETINITSYAHEMMHVAECPLNGGDEQHASWGSHDVADPESKWGAVYRARQLEGLE